MKFLLINFIIVIVYLNKSAVATQEGKYTHSSILNSFIYTINFHYNIE